MAQTSVNERVGILINHFEKSQTKFAEKIGVSAPGLHEIIAGRKSKPSFDFLCKIKKAYENVNLEWLITGEGEMLIHKKNTNYFSYEDEMNFKIAIAELKGYLRGSNIELLGKLEKFFPKSKASEKTPNHILHFANQEIGFLQFA